MSASAPPPPSHEISTMKHWMKLGMFLGTLALTSAAAHTVAPQPAMAQQLEFCPDLGVLVSHSGGGLTVQGMRRGFPITRQLGLRPGDLIFAINGQHPNSLSQLHGVLFAGADNEDHDIDVLRDGAHLHAAVYHVNGQVFARSTLH